ncbi:unannotated protein [freshwater metagenome]|uniref:Unannotated protein n=1 Tax=freshwater metagenome TaxID=449393 RepID=A0A6J7C5R6_9ZZZZ
MERLQRKCGGPVVRCKAEHHIQEIGGAPCSFDHRHPHLGGQPFHTGCVQAHQGLSAGDLVGLEVHDRLVDEVERAGVEGSHHLRFQIVLGGVDGQH